MKPMPISKRHKKFLTRARKILHGQIKTGFTITKIHTRWEKSGKKGQRYDYKEVILLDKKNKPKATVGFRKKPGKKNWQWDYMRV